MTTGNEGQGTGTQPPPPAQPRTLDGMTPEQLAGLSTLQARINSIAAEEKRQGRTSAERELVEQFGMPLDKLKEFVEGARAAELAAMSEADRKAAEADAKAAAADERTRLANETIADMLAVTALTGAGMTQQQAQAAKGMLVLPPGQHEGEAYITALGAAVENLKATFPTLFPAPGNPNDPPPPPGYRPPAATGSGGKPGGTGKAPTTARERAAARMESRGRVRTPANGSQ